MFDMRYFGKYYRFDTESKSAGIFLLNADNIIGDEYSIAFEVEQGKTTAWLYNKFQKKVGFFSQDDTYQLDVLRAREWKLHALLSVVMYTESENEGEDGKYWGEVAVIAHPERYSSEIETYLKKVGAQFVEGIRPEINLTEVQINEMIAAQGDWVSPDHLTPKKKERNTAVVKSDVSLSEKIIEQGRSGNTGCYIASYAFLAVLAVGIGALVTKLLGIW